jgi:hypothetical protein
MTLIKNTTIALAMAAALSTAAYAGGMDAPVMEPEIIVQETTDGSGRWWVGPLIILGLVAAVASAN